jgi:hypothetical protein
VNQLIRLSSSLAGVGCAVALVLCVARSDVGGAFHAVRPAASGKLTEDGQRLDELRLVLLDSAEMKRHIIEDVMRGELTLLEAAAEFRAAEADLPPEVVGPTLQVFPGQSYEEQLCRKVIRHVQAFHDRSQRRLLVAERFKAELEEHLHKHGTVRLGTGDEEGQRS